MVAATNSWRDYLTLHPPYASSVAPFPVFSALDLGLCPYTNCKPLPADGRLMPTTAPEAVRDEVRRRMRLLGKQFC